jgi:23S rRNA (cytidine1920-2'-O)/16S rRNA (cytidine1409-2'-O)-methyltransferase
MTIMRLDQYIVHYFGLSRARAQLLIRDGSVTFRGKVIKKSSLDMSNTIDPIDIVITDTVKYVSRAGLKLEHALREFSVDVSDKNCLDIGSSTGGFTDCLLQYGAIHVDCVDVGSDQLHITIKDDLRVSVYEQTDIRNFNPSHIYDVIVCDVSFISLVHIIPELPRFSDDNTRIILLIKPQFEVGKEFLNKQGIVTSDQAVQDCIQKIKNTLHEFGFAEQGIIPSPINGGDGNQEFLTYCCKS